MARHLLLHIVIFTEEIEVMLDVGIVIRTQNRPLMLERALKNLSEQTLTSWEAVVVNDGGMIEAIDNLCFSIQVPEGCQLRVIHLEDPRGTAYAYNRGLRTLAETKYRVVREDINTWEPDFLEKTTRYLNQRSELKVYGVVTHCSEVKEKYLPNAIRVGKKKPCKTDIARLDAPSLVERNPIHPIAFLFTPLSYDLVGGFDEKLPMFAEWDFYLRYLLRFEIEVMPERLAVIHEQEDAEENSGDALQHNSLAYSLDFLRKRWMQLPPDSAPLAPEVIRRAGEAIQQSIAEASSSKKKSKGLFSFLKRH